MLASMSDPAIARFLAARAFAVAGASSDRAKFGNRVLRHYHAHGRDVVAIHPRETAIEGIPAYSELARVPTTPEAVSIVTPPAITARIVDDALALGIALLWMQPGAESPDAIRRALDRGAEVIHGGPCVLVELR